MLTRNRVPIWVAITAVVAGIVLMRPFSHRVPEYPERLLRHFDLDPNDYTYIEGQKKLPLRFVETDTLSYGNVMELWNSTVMSVGDHMPMWFEMRQGGIFVIVEKADGSLVGTPWYVSVVTRIPVWQSESLSIMRKSAR